MESRFLLVAVTVGVVALLLNGPDGSTPVSAAEACNLMDTPYDALLTSTTPFGETRAEIRYSGSDEHIVMTTTDHEGVLLGKGEMILKDRTRYSRESTPGNPGLWRMARSWHRRSRFFSLPCLIPAALKRVPPARQTSRTLPPKFHFGGTRRRCGTSTGSIPQGVPHEPAGPSFRRNMTE